MSFINKTGFMQNNHKTLCKPIIERILALNLASSSNSTSFVIAGEDFTDLEGGFFVDVDE